MFFFSSFLIFSNCDSFKSTRDSAPQALERCSILRTQKEDWRGGRLRRRRGLDFAAGSSGGERERECFRGEASVGVEVEGERGAEAEDEAGEEDKVETEKASSETQVEKEG